jgi:leucyl-tRNA synthetase
MDVKVLNEMRASFLYWYPVDLRNSAKELIPNHLTFFAFHHAALFPEGLWPRGFSVNGMIQIEGQKMSKSRGVFVTWRQALEKYGADALRATLALAADGMDDADWKSKNAEDLRVKIDSLFPFLERNLSESVKRDPNHLDRWLISTTRRRIEETTVSLESMKIRRGLAVALNDVWNDVRWYLRREPEPRRQTLQLVFESWIRLLSPFIPFAAEELNRRSGGKGIISIADWPSPRDFPTDQVAETSEVLVNRVLDDARNLLKIFKQSKSRLNIYVGSDEARNYFLELAAAERDHTDRGAVIKKYARTGIKPERIIKHRHELGEALVALLSSTPEFDEYDVLASAAKFISREIGLEVAVFKAGKGEIYDPTKKAVSALPFKPAFYLE